MITLTSKKETIIKQGNLKTFVLFIFSFFLAIMILHLFLQGYMEGETLESLVAITLLGGCSVLFGVILIRAKNILVINEKGFTDSLGCFVPWEYVETLSISSKTSYSRVPTKTVHLVVKMTYGMAKKIYTPKALATSTIHCHTPTDFQGVCINLEFSRVNPEKVLKIMRVYLRDYRKSRAN